VSSQTGVPTNILLVPAGDWRRIIGLTLFLGLAYVGLLVLENYAIARIDWWLAIDSFEDGAWYSVFISVLSLWLRLCIIGVGVFVAFNALRADGGLALPKKFLSFWCVVCLVFALSFLAIDLFLQDLQFTTEPLENVTMRWIWLSSVYVRIALLYFAARFLLGGLSFTGEGSNRAGAAWRATTTWQSLGLVFGILVIKMIIDGVFVNLVSYLPIVSPFWFVPDEMSPMRHIVGQGAWIIAQGCGVFIYVAFFVAAGRRISQP